jgi:rhamnose utilization protein RhaD (predicted bifunctional aldolase and dehydrogenase)
MQSRWNDISALDAVETYAEKGVSEDLALRVYTTRLLGRDPCSYCMAAATPR